MSLKDHFKLSMLILEWVWIRPVLVPAKTTYSRINISDSYNKEEAFIPVNFINTEGRNMKKCRRQLQVCFVYYLGPR